MDRWFVIMSALLFISRAEDAARARARARHRSTSVRSDQEKMKDLEKFLRKKEMRRSISASEQYTDDVISSHPLFGQWADQRTTRNTSNRSTMKPSAFGVSFLKCAQVDRGVELRVTLLVRNPEEGHDLSQLCIRDSVSDVTLLQTNGSVQERGYQTFSTDTLPAGSQFVVLYRMRVKGNRKQFLTLPAFLTFSNATQNDIHLFGPVVANFTLRINTPEQVDVDLSLLFLGFLGSFLLSLLLLSLSVVGVKLLQRRRISAHTRSSVNEEAGPYEGTCDITASANEEAAFEDKFVDILMLEDPQNMMEALDSLSVSTLSRAAVALERVRVQMFKGLVSVLLAGVRAERRVLGVVHGQIVGMEGKVQEDHVARMKALAAQCNLETQEQIESLQRKHTSEAAHAERLLQHAPQQQDHPDVRALLEELHQREQKRLQKRLRVRHEHASAQTLRQQTLSRRFELHKILGEELDEAVRTGELKKTSANTLLLQYYSCQDVLEEGLDVILANQRALLAKRHAQRRFLAKSLQSLQTVTSEAFSRDTHRECSDVQREILSDKQSLEETVCRERRAIRCDIIKRRRQLLSEKVCEHWRQLQAVSGSSDVTVNQYLQKWTELLIMQNNELSDLINHLDEETAARTRKVSVCVLQTALAQLKVRSQTQAVQESLQRRGQAAARELRSTQSLIRQQHQQELEDQTRSRDAFRQYCSALVECQRSLSHEQRVRLQLECVKAACRLDRCLVLHHTICELERLGDPCVTPAGSETELQRSSEVTELQCFQRCLQERLRRLRSDTHSDTLPREACVFQEQQLSACQECVAVFVASLQWEQAEKKTRVTETHTALLKLQTLITAELHSDITHAIHTHRLALEEAELQLQQEVGLWEESAEGQGSDTDDDDDDDDEEGMFAVNADAGVSVLLQEALFKRQQLQRLTDRELRRNQTLEHHREKLQLKRLQTYCDQDVAFTAALVKQALITDPDLHTLLRLLLPTVPEGELLSLTETLGAGAGGGSGCGVSLVDRLKLDLLSRNSHSPQHRDRERDRLIKKRQKLLDKLLCGGSGDVHETRRRRRRTPNIPVRKPEEEAELEAEPGAGHMMRGGEGVWPMGMAQDSTMRDGNEGAWPVGVTQDSTVRDGNEGVWPLGMTQDRTVRAVNEWAWPVGVTQDSTVRDGNEGAWPVGVVKDSTVRDGNEGAWPVGVTQDSTVRDVNEWAWPVGVTQDSTVRDGNEGAWPVGVVKDSTVRDGNEGVWPVGVVKDSTVRDGNEWAWPVGVTQDSTVRDGNEGAWPVGVVKDSTVRDGNEGAWPVGVTQDSTVRDVNEWAWPVGVTQDSTVRDGNEGAWPVGVVKDSTVRDVNEWAWPVGVTQDSTVRDGNEGAWPVGVVKDSTMRDGNEGVWPVGVTQDSTVRDVNEGVWPVGVVKDSTMRDGNEGAWPVGVTQDSTVRDGNEGAWPVGVTQDSTVRDGNEGAWPVGVTQYSTVRDGNEGAWPVGVTQDSTVRDVNEGAWPVGVANHNLVSSERLFVFRCVPPSAQQETRNTRSRKKKRNFLNFKKASVTPEQHT